MRSDVIKILIVAVTVAVLSLIGMQYYWVRNAVELKRTDFERKVGDALNLVSSILEKKETLEHLRMQQQGRYLFIDDDAEDKLMQKGLDTTYNYMVVKQYERKGDKVKMSVTEERDGKQVTRSKEILNADIEDLMHEDGADFSYRGVGPETYLLADGIAITDGVAENKFKKKKAFVGDIVKSLMEVTLLQPLEERINEKELDSLIELALSEKGIHANYQFAVYNRKGKLILANPDSASLKISDSVHKTRLFKNDVVGNPGFLKVYFPGQTGYLLKANGLMLTTSLFIVLAIIYIFFWTVRAIITQKRNSDIKNDFINNMTHELKTPISTISLACEVLSDPGMSVGEQTMKRYVGMINEENKRLGLLVEEVLQSAVLDKGDFRLKNEPVDLRSLVVEVVGKMQIKVKERSGTIALNLPEEGDFIIRGDKVHLANILYNLIDNAIKYSPENPVIDVKLTVRNEMFALSVTDHGMGISKEHRKKVFDKLYRVPTGNLHDVKGFGLGLNYVTTILRKINGQIELESKLGEGSTFTVLLPKDNTEKSTN